jgi:hypothetical protein
MFLNGLVKESQPHYLGQDDVTEKCTPSLVTEKAEGRSQTRYKCNVQTGPQNVCVPW